MAHILSSPFTDSGVGIKGLWAATDWRSGLHVHQRSDSEDGLRVGAQDLGGVEHVCAWLHIEVKNYQKQ